MTMSNGNEPAYPCIGAPGAAQDFGGLTKREAFAMAIFQGLAANPGGPWQANASNGWALANCSLSDVAEVALDAADALIEALAKDPK